MCPDTKWCFFFSLHQITLRLFGGLIYRRQYSSLLNKAEHICYFSLSVGFGLCGHNHCSFMFEMLERVCMFFIGDDLAFLDLSPDF